MDNKTHKSTIKSHSRRSRVCCCTRTRWHVLSYFDKPANLTIHLSDAHAHIIENGYMMELPLAGSTSVQGEIQPITFPCLTEYLITEYLEVVERVKAYILSHPDVQIDTTRWIEGWGWDQTKWPIAQFPTAVRFNFTTDRMMSSYYTTQG